MAIFNSYLRLKAFEDHYEREYVRPKDVIHGEETRLPLKIGIGEEVKIYFEGEKFYTITRGETGLRVDQRITIPVIESETPIIEGVEQQTDEKLDVHHNSDCTNRLVIYKPNPPKP